MRLRDIDLNLLVVFNQMLMDRSASVAAERLGMSQPAVSNALRRLRELLNDELFVRTAKGMEPTPYALHLAEPVVYALNALQTALSNKETFDPRTSERTFNLAMTDIGEMYFMPPLMDALAELAPGIQVQTHRASAGDIRESMASGAIDLALGLMPALQSGFFQKRLFRQRYVCMFRRGHPTARAPISLAQFKQLEHVGVTAPNTGHGEINDLLVRAGITRRIRLLVPHFIAVGHILQSTDLIATLPERFAERSKGPFDLVVSPHPVDLPEIAINMFWHAKYHRDPDNMWLRQQISEQFSDPSPP
ncbi:MAG: LysR family transcriptional regulator [Burkholderiaceae bacterium]